MAAFHTDALASLYKVGAPDQGYDTDIYTAGEAVRWLRTEGQA